VVPCAGGRRRTGRRIHKRPRAARRRLDLPGGAARPTLPASMCTRTPSLPPRLTRSWGAAHGRRRCCRHSRARRDVPRRHHKDADAGLGPPRPAGAPAVGSLALALARLGRGTACSATERRVLAAAARLDRRAGSEGGGEARGGARAVWRRLGGFPGRRVCPRGWPAPAPPCHRTRRSHHSRRLGRRTRCTLPHTKRRKRPWAAAVRATTPLRSRPPACLPRSPATRA